MSGGTASSHKNGGGGVVRNGGCRAATARIRRCCRLDRSRAASTLSSLIDGALDGHGVVLGAAARTCACTGCTRGGIDQTIRRLGRVTRVRSRGMTGLMMTRLVCFIALTAVKMIVRMSVTGARQCESSREDEKSEGGLGVMHCDREDEISIVLK